MDRFTLDEIAAEKGAGALIRPKNKGKRQSSFRRLSGQHRLLDQQRSLKRRPTGIWETVVGSSFLGAALVVAILPSLLTRSTIATGHTSHAATDSVALNNSRQALVSQVLSDQQARTAYLRGDFKALHERLKTLGIADEAEEYYLQNFANVDSLDDYPGRNWDEQADYQDSFYGF